MPFLFHYRKQSVHHCKKIAAGSFLYKTPDAGDCVLIAEDHTIKRLEYLFEVDKLINILDLTCVRQKGIPETGNVL